MSEDEWDLVFELAADLAPQPPEAQRERLQALAVPEQVRKAVLRQIRLGEPPVDCGFGICGERIGTRITLRRHLRDGGSGSVYLGIHTDSRGARPTAVKLIRIPLPPAARALLEESWRHERRLLQELSLCGATPALLEAGEHTGLDGSRFYYLCMEYRYGLDLRSWCEQHGLGVRERVELFAQVCEAVATLHAHGLVHGDLKPDNIQIQLRLGRSAISILDLGLAVVQGQPWHAGEALIGTPGYMSPEQVRGARGSRGGLRETTDVYALGLTLFELLAGRPWLAQTRVCTARELQRRMRQRGSPQLTELEPSALRHGLNDVLARATAWQPRRRYTQLSALRGAVLRAVQQG